MTRDSGNGLFPWMVFIIEWKTFLYFHCLTSVMSLSWSVARQVSPKVSSFDIDCASPQTARTTMVYLINPLCIFLCTFCSSNQSNRKVSYWHFSSYLIARDLRWHWDLTLVFSADIDMLAYLKDINIATNLVCRRRRPMANIDIDIDFDIDM